MFDDICVHKENKKDASKLQYVTAELIPEEPCLDLCNWNKFGSFLISFQLDKYK